MMNVLTVRQVKAGRALLAWSQGELAFAARVAVSTIADFERGVRTPVPNNMQAIRDALESKGLRFMAGGVVSGSSMPKPPASKPGVLMRWIGATDLAQWGERRDGQGGVPELLRRLIFATLGPAAVVTFPSDDSVQHSGWDGLCETEEGAAYVPVGTSGWEMGAQRSGIRGKADDDYQKRSGDPLGMDRRTATFVFVTPQRFTGKAAWRAEKLAAKAWRDIRVIDADDLVHWLELCPGVAQWLAASIGRRPQGLRNLGEVWEEWRRATRVPLSAEVMVTDRDEEASAVLKWLRGPPAHFAVQAGSTEEATAFLRAALDDLPEDYRLAYESRCLVATDADTARDLVGIGTPLVIVLPDGDAGLVQHLVADGHHVYAAYGPAVLRAGNARALPRPWRYNLQVALVRMGVPEEDAHQLSRGSGRSLAVLRRLMPAAPTFLPRWAAEPFPELIAAMLAGSWNQTSAADRKVVAALAGRPYETFEESLTPLTTGQEPPLLRSGPMWKLVSLRDAWTLLAPLLSAAQLQRFEKAFHEVFSIRDPRFHLAGRKTWYERHGEFGEEVSPELRRGLAEAMVALGVYPEAARAIPDAGGRAEQAVCRLLKAADAELWWSLSGDFRRLAEASPRAFLDAVEDGLDREDKPVMALFRSDEGLMTRTEYLADLLWALEMLARSPDHLLQSALLLARLDSVDPGGKWGNRPGASLRRILLSWSPQTYAGPEQRLKVIDAIIKRFPQVGWNLLVRLAPRLHDTSDFSPMPDWRDFAPDQEEEISWVALQEAAAAIGRRMLDHAGLDPDRWEQVLDNWAAFDPSWREQAGVRLAETVRVMNDPAAIEAMRDSIRDLLAKHRGFAGTEWAMPEADLAPLEMTFQSLPPQDIEDRSRWLFRPGNMFFRPNVPWDVLQSEQAARQREAATELLGALDPERIYAFAGTITMHHALGLALAHADVGDSTKEVVVEVGLRSSDSAHGEVANTMMLARAQVGKLSLPALWARGVSDGWGDVALLRIARAMPAVSETWHAVAAVSAELDDAYWRTMHVHGIPDIIAMDAVFGRLIEVGRGQDLVSWLAHRTEEAVPARLLIQALEAAVREPVGSDGHDPSMLGYRAGLLLDRLQAHPDVAEADLVRLEWTYFQVLRHSQRPTMTLHRALSRDPELFVSLLKMIFLPEPDSGVTEEPPEDLAHATRLATQAYDVLHDWAHVPGADERGAIDPAALEAWVKVARKLLAEAGREAIGDRRIGEILSASAPQPDEPWPPQAVRDVVETCRSRDLETGIEMGVYNRRGVTVRSPHDGGEQERALVARYRRDAGALRFDAPRTAAILDRIANFYEADAQREDESAEQRDWQ